jgi:2-keto-4-pentenoate hydratase/2-oxohepta-3-ene-1,7-dioic acid hydratase in catechol pathway
VDLLAREGRLATRSRTSYRHAHWIIAQLVAHHAVNGCNLQPGDGGPASRGAGRGAVLPARRI